MTKDLTSAEIGWDEDERELAEQIVDRARSEGLDLVGPDGVLTGLTKKVLEAGLEAELIEHLGYDKHDPAGRNSGNSRNGTRSKPVLTGSVRCPWTCPGIVRAASTRSWSASVSGACVGSTRW